MSKAVLNSSVIIALSNLGYLNKLQVIFKRILVAKAVYEEICIAGQGKTAKLLKTHQTQLPPKNLLLSAKVYFKPQG